MAHVVVLGEMLWFLRGMFHVVVLGEMLWLLRGVVHVVVLGEMQGRIQSGAHPSKIGKNMIFWRNIVIFHTKYPTNFRASLRNW